MNRHPSRPLPSSGFTMIELVITMVLVGIMAFVALPRLDALGGFDARGAADQMEAVLRFAQKSALAQRRYVTITVTDASTAPSLLIGTACASGSSFAFPGKFATPRSSVTVTGATTLCFDTLGGTSPGASIGFKDNTGTLVRTITVEATTGYVHSS